ncbi:hypothetical protein BS47DRAFT_772058 [Hydnum rufescens UP504]|uniref:Uncharacterized protein n=1 Tax=Hydnum rufescens UP504 TaxID=1448309 RepID=A0A9P6B0V0_9AGAM|nr:hypothetical protein BS47DRAFT_772058 [Hydnum rufescens UP504]
MYVELENLEIELHSVNLPSRRCTMLEDSNHSVLPISYTSRELLVGSQLKPNSLPNVWRSHFHIRLDVVPVQRVARYRQIRWPFYHQFTMVTTVEIPPTTLRTNMFFLQTKEGRNVLLDDLDPCGEWDIVQDRSYQLNKVGKRGFQNCHSSRFRPNGNYTARNEALGRPRSSRFRVDMVPYAEARPGAHPVLPMRWGYIPCRQMGFQGKQGTAFAEYLLFN